MTDFHHRCQVADCIYIGQRTSPNMCKCHQSTDQIMGERIETLEMALENIAIYGCGMLSQPPAMNGEEASWLRMRIAEYERCASEALRAPVGGKR